MTETLDSEERLAGQKQKILTLVVGAYRCEQE